MTQKLPLTLFAAQDFLRCKLSPDRMEAVVLDDTRGAIRITGADGIIGGTDWSSFRGFYLTSVWEPPTTAASRWHSGVPEKTWKKPLMSPVFSVYCPESVPEYGSIFPGWMVRAFICPVLPAA